jgi:structure-specific recognition protein 1
MFNFAAEERQPYVEQSIVDKKRYADETAAYRGAAAAPVDVDSGDDLSD